MLHLCHGFNCVFHFNRFLFFLFIVLLFNWFFQYCDVVGIFFLSFVIFACSLSILPCQLSSIDRFIFINHVLRWIDTPCEHTYYIKNGINTFFLRANISFRFRYQSCYSMSSSILSIYFVYTAHYGHIWVRKLTAWCPLPTHHLQGNLLVKCWHLFTAIYFNMFSFFGHSIIFSLPKKLHHFRAFRCEIKNFSQQHHLCSYKLICIHFGSVGKVLRNINFHRSVSMGRFFFLMKLIRIFETTKRMTLDLNNQSVKLTNEHIDFKSNQLQHFDSDYQLMETKLFPISFPFYPSHRPAF